jgi:hypothetical protein
MGLLWGVAVLQGSNLYFQSPVQIEVAHKVRMEIVGWVPGKLFTVD